MKDKIKLLVISIFSITIFIASSAFGQQDPDRVEDGVIRVLAIGNSFSEDGIENYLHELAQAAGKSMIIGNLYIGGAALSLHVENVRADKAAYDYRKIDLNGEKTSTAKVKISDALLDEPWDYISLQQVSSLSGDFESYQKSLPELYAYVAEHVQHKDQVGYILHQTWAYQQDSQHKGFAKYNNDQSKMYKDLAATSKSVYTLVPIDLLVPAGTAIQNARTSFLGDTFTRDGYHLELNYGRFTAACAWFESLFSLDVRDNPYKPASVSQLEAEIAKAAAHEAILRPFEATVLEQYVIMEASN